jgi:hypothetical protein
LREGLVESLGGQKGGGSMNLDALDADLRHPSDAAVSRRAHAVAANLVASLCSRYGLSGVRGFLRTGVPTDALNILQPGKHNSALRNAASDF